MNNIQKLAANGNKNHRIFAATVVDLMNSQGFYGRLYRSVNEMAETVMSSSITSSESRISKIRSTSCFGWNAERRLTQ